MKIKIEIKFKHGKLYFDPITFEVFMYSYSKSILTYYN